MRFSSYALPVIAANLVAALPAPQEIDLDMVLAAPDPTYTEAVGVTAQTITFNSAAIVAEATATISSVSVDSGDVLSATAVAHEKRAAATCVKQPTGASSAPTYSAAQDNADTFAANTYYASVASAAPTPSGYTQSFLNKQASNNAFGYMGFDTLDTYDVNTCAQRCTTKQGCVSVNIYFERDPSVDPNAASCLNPSSVTMIKCVYWGGPATADNAVNKGQMRGDFDVRIAGSNGYITNQLSTPAGFQDAVPYGKFAINAPYDAQGYNTFMGSKIFTQGTWNVNLCSDYCDSQTTYNLKTAPKDGTPAKVCKFFNTYILTAKKADGTIVPQGQYCSLYTEAWPIKYATNGGQWRGQDQYTVDYSFGYSKTDAGFDPLVGDAKGAVYQAVGDIKWGTLQPYCSTLLGYTTPITTVTQTATSTPLITVTSTATITSSITLVKRDGVAPTAFSVTDIAFDGVITLHNGIVTTQDLDSNSFAKRAAPTSTPADLKKYPVTVVSSACSLQASPVTSTSTVYTTATTTAATSTISQLSSTTVTVIPSGCPTVITTGGWSGIEYKRFFFGQGLRENTNNPGNRLSPALVQTYDGTLAECDAAQKCATYGINYPGSYFGFDLHFLQSTKSWECNLYWDPNTDASYYNVVDPDVIAAYGYCTYC